MSGGWAIEGESGMTVLRAVVATLVVATGLLILETRAAFACSCDADVQAAELLAKSDAAFVGVYTGRDDPFAQGPLISSGRRVVNHFVVERSVKGELGGSIDVEAAADGASCGLELERGERTGLFVRREGDSWSSSLCAQAEPDALLAFASPGADPASIGDGLLDDGLFLAVGLLVVAATAAVAIGRLRRPSS